MSKEYVVVTTISQFRHRYVISLDKLQEMNKDVPVNPEWALDMVTCEEIEEMSQYHMGETIVDWTVENEDQLLKRFDKENDYLAGWSQDQKLYWINSTYDPDKNNG